MQHFIILSDINVVSHSSILYSMFKKAVLATFPCATSCSAGFPEKRRKMFYNMHGGGGVGNVLYYDS